MHPHPLDSSSAPSSTAMNIHQYIQATNLSDHSPDSTAQTSAVEPEKTQDASFHFINEGNPEPSQAVLGDQDSHPPQSDDHSIRLNQQLEHSSSSNDASLRAEAEILAQKSPEKIIQESAYQKKLKYRPNVEFQAGAENKSYPTQSEPGSPLQSIPNTFKYKSHPNARTKSFIGASANESLIQESPELLPVEHEKEDYTPPIRTSTIRDNPVPPPITAADFNTTPDWMPTELADKWEPPAITKKKDQAPEAPIEDLGLDFASGNTMIHNSDYKTSETPMWKKATKEYEIHKQSQPNLQNIFTSMDSHERIDVKDSHLSNKNAHHSISSTLSTPMATMSQHNSLPRNHNNEELKEVQNILEQESRLSYKFPGNPESPLKLFHDDYNTYTKDKLNGLLQRMNNKSNLQTPIQLDTINEDNDRPKLNIKNFTKTGSYTEQQFLQNANNVFNNIQKRGFMGKFENTARSISNSHTTATSTPKNFKAVNREELQDDAYSSFTSAFGESSESNIHQYNTDDGINGTDGAVNEYTSFDHSNKNSNNRNVDETIDYLPRLPSMNLASRNQKNHTYNDSSYTFDEFSDDNEKPEPIQNFDSLSTKNNFNNNPVYESSEVHPSKRHIEDTISHQPSILQNSTNIIETHDDYDKMQNFIKWKRASQLKLLQSPKPPNSIIKDKNVYDQSILKGRVKPGIDLPVAYENMVLDVKNQRWIANDDKENFRGSLDSIEDLVSRTEEQDFEDSKSFKHEGKLKSRASLSGRRGNSKLEVSFHLPHLDFDRVTDKSPLSDDVTQVSQLDDITFTQTQKKLVSVVTEILSSGDTFDDISWNEVSEINLSEHQLDSIKDLNKFLPKLKKVDLSGNEIKYLDGLPKSIHSLNISSNNIENITSFYQYRDLQRLDVSSNRMLNLTNFGKNIHLTHLNVANNKLTSLDGVSNLVNLAKLNVSQNSLKGHIDFTKVGLHNLQELNMSENRIESLDGLENLLSLRILNLNENELIQVSCKGKHEHLKKLLLKFNSLSELDLNPYPHLRVLRLDGNSLELITDIKKLRYLEEISCKSQNSPTVLKQLFTGSSEVHVLDLSGNSNFNLFHPTTVGKQLRSSPFLNVNRLVLSAMNLTKIPDTMADLFPNVRELNLNFNKLKNIVGLSKFQYLKKLYMVSNNINKTEILVTGLIGSRRSLKVLDLRLNPCNIELYPYVFNPQELEYANLHSTDNISPIQLETLDDIESFAIHYQSLSKGVDDWTERDTKFINKLTHESNSKVRQRLNYETLLINFFKSLVRLDGGLINKEKRIMFSRRLLTENNSHLHSA
ncbi:L domain-like protein [Suhomyces tanzawaensis NRRL Y-17324]|uniref:L domain-like protein n=1 Tax=Suhomyces tanzawaensis NRRL Y-17324 TaxID=984487 RepID=A0A1E4SIN9_9ASCO|nr:L domain-like protein [Suhomyces tanzawaensis NRRL Y-17324]ODV79369.1 L domain-like protein [Suhomyces tanzawaensis NRRL Y-17324]